jgi:hypothetical protein
VSQHLSLLKLHPQVQAMMLTEDEQGDEDGAGTRVRLTFVLGQMLAPLDEKQQIKLATQITRNDGMSMVAARRLIIGKRREAGVHCDFKTGSTRAMRGLESTIADVADKVGVYLDMPISRLNQFVDSMSHFDKRKLIESIEELADNLTGLAEAVEARLPAKAGKS